MDELTRVAEAKPLDAKGIKALEMENGLAPWPLRDYEAEADSETAVFLVLRQEGHKDVAGFILVRLITGDNRSRAQEDLPLEAEIVNFAVAPELRGKGFGKLLLRSAIDRLTRFGPARVYLEVRRSNEEAKNFYLGQGFRETGLRTKFYSSPAEDAVLMELVTDKTLADDSADGLLFIS